MTKFTQINKTDIMLDLYNGKMLDCDNEHCVHEDSLWEYSNNIVTVGTKDGESVYINHCGSHYGFDVGIDDSSCKIVDYYFGPSAQYVHVGLDCSCDSPHDTDLM